MMVTEIKICIGFYFHLHFISSGNALVSLPIVSSWARSLNIMTGKINGIPDVN